MKGITVEFYPTLLTLHIIFAGGWIISFISDLYLKSNITKNKGLECEKNLIRLYLKLSNLTGMISATGILITGIFLVLINPAYSFFQMTSNHWLTTKQILMLILLLIIFLYIIPSAKKLKTALGENLNGNNPINEEGYYYLKKIFKLNHIINLIVIINFLLAITHRFIN